jgi:hypothetical protein
MEIKFKKIVNCDYCHDSISIPKMHNDLSELVLKQLDYLLSVSSKYSFESMLKNCDVIGEFEANESSNSTYKIFTFGLPNCITKVSLQQADADVSGLLDFSKGSGLKVPSLELGPFPQTNLKSLLKILKSYVRLLTIWEQFNLLQESQIEIESLHPSIKFLYQNIAFMTNENGDIIVISEEQRNYEFENFIQSDSFSIYDFIDKLLENIPVTDSTMKKSDDSPDLTWLSDSFM